MAQKSAIELAGASRVVKASVFRRLGRPIAQLAAVLAATLLMAPPAGAQLYTGTGSTGNWSSTRWASGTAGPFTQNWVSGSATQFTTGTYTFANMFASPTTGTIGNVTTAANVNISFGNSSSQTMTFGNTTKTFDLGAGSLVDFGSVSLAGTNGLTKNGDGTLVLSGGAYTGGMTLNAGNVIARGANAFGTGALTINGGKIGTTGGFTSPVRTGGPIVVGGDFQIGIADSPASNSANLTFSTSGNGLNLDAGTRRITLGSSGSMTFGQVISNGGLTLARNAAGAAGSFGLSGNNTFADGLTIDDVAVNVFTQNNVLGVGSVTLQGASAATLNIRSSLTIGNNFTIADSAGTKTITNFTSNATITGKITNLDSTGGLTIGAANGRIFTIGDIEGFGGVTFGGGTLPGIVVMTGAGTYWGDTVIDNSTLRMGPNGSVSATNLVFQQTAGSTVPTFDLNGTEQTIAGLDDSAVAGIIRSNLSGGKLIVGDANDSTFRGTIISANSMELEKVGTGKLTLTGANTYTNGTKITAGELEVSSQSLKGDVFNRSTLTFNQTVSGTFAGDIYGDGSLIKKGNDALTLTGGNSYSGGTTVSAGDLIGSTDALQGDIVVTNNATVTFRQSVDGTYAGGMSGAGALVKEGPGNVALSGANSYSGLTTVSAGTLALSGTGSIGTGGLNLGTTGSPGVLELAGLTASSYSLPSSAALAGVGTIAGNGKTLAVLGSLAPGNSAGTITVGTGLSLDLSNSGSSVFVITNPAFNAGTFDLVNGDGSVVYGGILNLAFSGGSYANATDVLQIFANTGGRSGNFSAVNATGLAAGQSATFNPVTGTISVVPEPSAYAMALAGLACGGYSLFRRRRAC